MVLLKSEKTKFGIACPEFSLNSVDGKRLGLSDFKDKQVLTIFFICSHCPYVQAIEERILALWDDLKSQSVQFVGICSNDPTEYPDDSPANLLRRWQQKNYGFPYLIDETQEVAKSFGAVCTPDIFVYDVGRKLAYHGQLDDHWQDASKVTRHDLRLAIEALLRGEKPFSEQISSMGCSIKWKKQ